MSDAGTSQGRFLDVFVIRSFRESHLEQVKAQICRVVESYESCYWGGVKPTKPFRVVDTNLELISGRWVRDEICRKIANAAISIVILDGMRHNVFFELGFLQARRRPFVLLKHRRFGPTFGEIDMDVSDLKGQVVKEYDHEDGDTFRHLIEAEIERCDQAFVHGLGTHLVIPLAGEADNLVKAQIKWQWDGGDRKAGKKRDHECTERGIEAISGAYEYELNRHISPTSLFILVAELLGKCSALTAFLEVCFRKAEKEERVWFGYSSRTVAPYGDHRGGDSPVEITVPLSVSESPKFELVDNIWKMVQDRLSTECVGPLRVSKIRLWGENEGALVSEVRITA